MFNKKKHRIEELEVEIMLANKEIVAKDNRIKELETEIEYANLDSMRYKEENYMIKKGLDT